MLNSQAIRRVVSISAAACILLFPKLVRAQLPDGATAPDWTATDINGTEWHLQSLLDEGKTAVIMFNATWLNISWNYLEEGALIDLYNAFGPDGTDDVMVFMIEGDDSTDYDDLMGLGDATVGNWVELVPFPIIDDGYSIFNDYEGAWYPMIYVVCPDGSQSQVGQATFLELVPLAFADCGENVSGPACMASVESNNLCGGEAQLDITLTNVGSDTITDVTMNLIDLASNLSVNGFAFDGLSIEPGGDAILSLPSMTVAGDYSMEITSVNSVESLTEAPFTIWPSVSSTNYLYLSILTDNWGEETTWEIIDESTGAVMDDYMFPWLTNPLSDTTWYHWWIELPAMGCYSFRVYDAWGDGVNGSHWGGTDGEISLTMHSAIASDPSMTYVNDAMILPSDLWFSEWRIGLNFDGDALYGCTDPAACNYWDLALEDDGSCHYPGCLDSTALNYAAEAICPDECIFMQFTCDFLGEAPWLEQPMEIFGFTDTLTAGVQATTTGVMNTTATISEGGNTYPIDSLKLQSISGLPEGLVWDSGEEVLLPSTQACISLTGTPEVEGAFACAVEAELWMHLFGNSISGGMIEIPFLLHVEANPLGQPGCTYATANNFEPEADVDDGSCVWLGCTDSTAVNFNSWATADDGSCYESEDSECTSDITGDGTVNVSDLLGVLAEFGMSCE